MRHVPVLIEEVFLEGGESALSKRGIGAPCGDVCIELRPRLNHGKEVINTREFRNVATGAGKELVVLCDGTGEVPTVGEVNERGQDGFLSGVNFVFDDSTEHDFEFANEIKR